MKPVTSPPKLDAVQRQWLRRLAVALSVAMVTGMILLAGFSLWVVNDTVSVVVVDERDKPVDGVAIQPVVVIGMVDAVDKPSGKVVIFDIEGLRKVGFTGAGPLVNPNTWQARTRAWASRFTQPYGIVMAWDKERPVYTAAGSARVPESPHVIAVSTGDLNAEPEDVFIIEAGFGRPAGGTPAKIVIRRPPAPAWLDKRVTWDMQRPTMDDFRVAIEAAAGISITLDWTALADQVGITSAAHFHDFSVRDLPLRSVLNAWLEDIDVTYLQIGDSIRITSRFEAKDWFETRLYSVGDLLGQSGEEVSQAGGELAEFISHTIGPSSWQWVGGAGDLFVCLPERTLVVSQPQQIHRQIEQLLTALRRGANPPPTDDDRRVLDALAKPISFDFRDEPFTEALARIGKLSGIDNIRFYRPALEEEGITGDCPITLRVQNMPLGSALRHLLGPLDLTTQVRDGCLVITSRVCADNAVEARIYPVADLIDDGMGGVDYDSLTELIGVAVAPNSWPSGTGPVPIEIFSRKACLGILQTRDVHTQIEKLLAVLRNGHGSFETVETEEENRIRHLLTTQPLSLDFHDEPLDRAMRRIAELAGIANVVIDGASIEEEGVKFDTPVSLRVENKPLATAVSELLTPLKLAAVVRADALVVVSAEEARQELKVRVYPAAELLAKTGLPDTLSEIVMQSVAPTTWSDAGGSCVIEFLPRRCCLVVLQTDPVHDELERFLEQLRGTSPLTDAGKCGPPAR